jgi:hypothetical protein
LRCQHERAHFRAAHRLPLRHVIADAFIARDNNPVLFTDSGQPLWIESVLSKMIVVYFDVETRRAKDRGHFVTAKLPIEKED